MVILNVIINGIWVLFVIIFLFFELYVVKIFFFNFVIVLLNVIVIEFFDMFKIFF